MNYVISNHYTLHINWIFGRIFSLCSKVLLFLSVSKSWIVEHCSEDFFLSYEIKCFLKLMNLNCRIYIFLVSFFWSILQAKQLTLFIILREATLNFTQCFYSSWGWYYWSIYTCMYYVQSTSSIAQGGNLCSW